MAYERSREQEPCSGVLRHQRLEVGGQLLPPACEAVEEDHEQRRPRFSRRSTFHDLHPGQRSGSLLGGQRHEERSRVEEMIETGYPEAGGFLLWAVW